MEAGREEGKVITPFSHSVTAALILQKGKAAVVKTSIINWEGGCSLLSPWKALLDRLAKARVGISLCFGFSLLLRCLDI